IADDHPIKHYLSRPSLTNTDDIFIKAIRKDEVFGNIPRIQICYLLLDKVKPIELNEEASVDTQIVLTTRLAHFEGFNNEVIYWFCAQTGSDRSISFFLTATRSLLECYTAVLSNREHLSSPLCLIISLTYQHVLQTEDEARKITYRTAVVLYETNRILDTELELDIRKLASLGLSLQEERVPWIFFATFSNQLQQLAKQCPS
ncbi:unnamed protein product, partial [Rotaria sp. Silwood1]